MSARTAPFCAAQGAMQGCRRRTRHESGLCAQHRSSQPYALRPAQPPEDEGSAEGASRPCAASGDEVATLDAFARQA